MRGNWRMKHRRYLNMLLAMLMVMGMIASVPFTASAAATTVTVNTWSELQSKVKSASKDQVIKLGKDIICVKNGGDRIVVEGKTITLDLNGHTLNRNRTKSDSNGHVIEVKGKSTLTIQDSVGTGVIKGGYAKRGGINIWDGTTTINSGTISGNTAKEKHGGGIYLGGATLNLYGGSITDNVALDEGGGIRMEKTDSGKLNVHGKPVVKENSATRGNNIFLRSGKKITVDGALSADAHLDVTLDDEYGTVTKNFSAHNKDQDPAQCFSSVEGCSVSVSSGEVVLGTAIGAVDEDSFIDRSSRIATYGSVSSKNWMAGISGERRLNEINIPGTHDSAMTDVIDHPFSSAGAFFGGPAAAQTQYNFINQQLNAGYRFFDLRLNNTYQVVHNVITYKIKDDKINLYLCHGTDSAGGTFWCDTPDDHIMHLGHVLDWVKDFLTQHPTETVLLSFSPESQDRDDYDEIMNRLKKIMRDLSRQTNPSTGESFLYMENGDYKKKYSAYPKLKDCRGKVVMISDYTRIGLGLTGYGTGRTKVYEPEGSYEDFAGTMIRNTSNFYVKHGYTAIPADVTTHLNVIYKVWLNCTSLGWKSIPQATPLQNARSVNPSSSLPARGSTSTGLMSAGSSSTAAPITRPQRSGGRTSST